MRTRVCLAYLCLPKMSGRGTGSCTRLTDEMSDWRNE